MTAKTCPGRFLRRRSSPFAGTRNWLLGVGVFVLVGGQASAFTAYVSNEKSNTISVVDTDKFTVVKTIKVGQRPRGIELTKDGKFILVAVGDDDTMSRTMAISSPTLRKPCAATIPNSARCARNAFTRANRFAERPEFLRPVRARQGLG